MRELNLFAATVCGAIGAACVLTSSRPVPMPSATNDTIRDIAAAEIGIESDDVDEDTASVLTTPAHTPLLSWLDAATSVWAPPTESVATEPLASRDVPALLTSTAAVKPGMPGSRTASGWLVVAQSVEGRPLHLKTIGNGGKRTLVIAGLDGEDRISVNWIDQFVQQVQQHPDALHDYQLLLLRAANPDGLTAKHHENARGVALNRNFPTANYQPGGNPSGGPGPASEPETRALMRLLYDLRPQRVVHLVATAARSDALCNGVASEATTSLEDAVRLPVESFNPRDHGGSLEDFATTVLGIEVVTLRLAIGEDWRSAALTHYPTLLTASVPQAHRGELAQQPRGKSRTQSQIVSDEEPLSAATTARRQSTGYEELPPPPHKRSR